MPRPSLIKYQSDNYADLRVSVPGLQHQIRKAGPAGGRGGGRELSLLRPEAFEPAVLHFCGAREWRNCIALGGAGLSWRHVQQPRRVRDELS
jgi:hypothetical protein